MEKKSVAILGCSTIVVSCLVVLAACSDRVISPEISGDRLEAAFIDGVTQGVGCGLLLENGTEFQLASVDRRKLPPEVWASGRRAARVPIGRGGEILKIVGPIEIPSDNHSRVTAICAIPFDASNEQVRSRLTAGLRSALQRGEEFRVERRDLKGTERDLLTQALFGEAEAALAPEVERRVHRLGRSTGETSASFFDPGDGSVSIAGLHITAIPGELNWLVDMREISAMWASLLRAQHGEIQTFVITYDGGPSGCAAASDAWFVLDELEDDLEALVSALEGGVQDGEEFDAELMCPDSLMQVGNTCLDFYIAQSTALGFMLGDARGMNPYAGIEQSKVQVVEDFNNNSVKLLIQGSTILLPTLTFSGLYPLMLLSPTSFGSSGGQVQVFRVDSLNADTRKLTMSISNSVCPAAQNWLLNYFPSSPPDWAMDMACPPIDAEVYWVRSGAKWVVDSVARDGFPNLDVIEKMSNGLLQVIHHSPSRVGGAVWLWGALDLLYKVREEKNQLMEEMNGSSCYLQ